MIKKAMKRSVLTETAVAQKVPNEDAIRKALGLKAMPSISRMEEHGPVGLRSRTNIKIGIMSVIVTTNT